MRGPERGAELAGAIRHEDSVRRDPALQAERLVKDWQRLENRHDKLRDNYLDRDARQKIEKQMQGIAGKLKRDPQLESRCAPAPRIGHGNGIEAGPRDRGAQRRQAMNEITRGRGRGLSLNKTEETMTEDQASDPAKAFEDLRAEVSVLRKAVEALPGAIRDNRPPDYAKDLAVIGKGLDEIGGQLETIQKSPALRMTPEQQGQPSPTRAAR